MLDGDVDGEPEQATVPPPEVHPTPPGGVLSGPEVGPSGADPTAYDPTLIVDPLPDGGVITPPPPPEAETTTIGLHPEQDATDAGSQAGDLIGGVATTGSGGSAVGPVPVGATPAF